MIEHQRSSWATLARAISERRPVRAIYHGKERLLCPHAIGWKNGQPKVFSLQAGGSTSQGSLPADPRQCWRSMFVDEIENPVITDDPWLTADNYLETGNGLEDIAFRIEPSELTRRP
jgi:hypothetical protein